jgi:hypothetical protein
MMFLVSFNSLLVRAKADQRVFVQEDQAIESVDQSGAEDVRVHWKVCLTHRIST